MFSFSRSEIRKKALLAIKYVHELDKDLVPNVHDYLRAAIIDHDPVVVSAALLFFYSLIKVNVYG